MQAVHKIVGIRLQTTIRIEHGAEQKKKKIIFCSLNLFAMNKSQSISLFFLRFTHVFVFVFCFFFIFTLRTRFYQSTMRLCSLSFRINVWNRTFRIINLILCFHLPQFVGGQIHAVEVT